MCFQLEIVLRWNIGYRKRNKTTSRSQSLYTIHEPTVIVEDILRSSTLRLQKPYTQHYSSSKITDISNARSERKLFMTGSLGGKLDKVAASAVSQKSAIWDRRLVSQMGVDF